MAIHVTLFRVNRTIASTIAMRHVQWMWLWGRIFVMMFVLTWCSHVCKSVSTPGDSHSACPPTHKSELPVRIVGGSFLHQGRIEILASEEWWTVCNNIWHPSNADVVCRQLGFLQADVLGPTLMGGAQFGQGQGPMFIEDFKCAGNESYLGQCSCSKPTTQSCQRAEDAVVSCQERPLLVRLVGGESPLDGAVEVLYGKQWLPVCHDQWGIDEATAVCQQLGFNYALSATALHPKETTGAGSPKSLRQRVDFSCPRWQEFLTQCKSSGPSVGNCVMNAGVVCSNQSSPNAGAVIRLSPEEGSSKGQVEIDYFGTWWSLCSEGWDIAAAQVACRQLGFQFALPVDLSEDCTKLTKSILISNIVCKGTEGSLAECQQEFATVDECNSDRMARVECSDSEPTPMPDFQVRLKDGYFPYEGRVEISYEGQWGTVCDDNWDYTDADVVCQQLGYYAANAAASQAYFGEGTGPILLDDVECLGNETHLLDCAHQGIGNHNCKHNEDAGVQCHESKIPLVTMYPEMADSFLPLIVVLINGLIALLIVISCLIYCSLKLWDRHVLRRHIAHIRQAQNATGGDNNTPMEYIDNPPAYNTVLENQDVYIRQRSETPPPDYDEVMKLHRADTTHV